MSPRDELFKQFGPKLIEALFMVLIDEINALRPGQGFQDITMEQVIIDSSNHVQSLPDYEWQSNEIGG